MLARRMAAAATALLVRPAHAQQKRTPSALAQPPAASRALPREAAPSHAVALRASSSGRGLSNAAQRFSDTAAVFAGRPAFSAPRRPPASAHVPPRSCIAPSLWLRSAHSHDASLAARAASGQAGPATAAAVSELTPLPPRLCPGDVHLWWLDPADVPASLDAAYSAWLEPKELSAATDPNSTPDVRRERLLSRALVRYVLGGYLSVPPADVRFVRGPFGKPSVEIPGLDSGGDGGAVAQAVSFLDFSVSHSRGGIVLAVSADCHVGADTEHVERVAKNGVERLAKRYFSPPEVELLSSAPQGADRQRLFVMLWTLKEAYVKALGRGIAGTPFRSFSVCGGRLAASSSDDGSGGGGGDSGGSAAAGGGWRPTLAALAGAAETHRVAPRGSAPAPEGGVDDLDLAAGVRVSVADSATDTAADTAAGTGAPAALTAAATTSGDSQSPQPPPRWRLALVELGTRHFAAVCAEAKTAAAAAATAAAAVRAGGAAYEEEARLRLFSVVPLFGAEAEEVGSWSFTARDANGAESMAGDGAGSYYVSSASSSSLGAVMDEEEPAAAAGARAHTGTTRGGGGFAGGIDEAAAPLSASQRRARLLSRSS